MGSTTSGEFTQSNTVNAVNQVNQVNQQVTQETLDIIESIVSKLAPKFTFGYYDLDDIKQEATIIALEKLSKFNKESGTLQSFLYTAISNSLKNFKRNKYHRLISKTCDNPECKKNLGQTNSKTVCQQCFNREKYINGKRNLMSPNDIEDAYNMPDSYHVDALESLEMDETLAIIDEKLPVDLRADYIKMRELIKIPKSRRLTIEAKITEILEEYYSDN